MSTPEHTATATVDPLRELALKIYVELVGRIYGDAAAPPDRPRAQPQVLAQMSFKFAEAFQVTDLQVNPRAIATRDAAAKAGVKLADIEMDFEKISPRR